MTKLTSIPERALDLASLVGDNLRNVGDNLRHSVPSMTHSAGEWLQTGVKLGALKSGARVAGGFVRRNPVLIAAAVAGAGLLWYAAKRRAQRVEAEQDEHAIEGSSRRVEARRGTGRRAQAPRRNPSSRQQPSRVEH